MPLHPASHITMLTPVSFYSASNCGIVISFANIRSVILYIRACILNMSWVTLNLKTERVIQRSTKHYNEPIWLTSTWGPSFLDSLPVATLVHVSVSPKQWNAPRVGIPQKALILCSGLTVIKVLAAFYLQIICTNIMLSFHSTLSE